jgi:hypothetical protein
LLLVLARTEADPLIELDYTKKYMFRNLSSSAMLETWATERRKRLWPWYAEGLRDSLSNGKLTVKLKQLKRISKDKRDGSYRLHDSHHHPTRVSPNY